MENLIEESNEVQPTTKSERLEFCSFIHTPHSSFPSYQFANCHFPYCVTVLSDSAGSHAWRAIKAYEKWTDSNPPSMGDTVEAKVLTDVLIRSRAK